MKHPRTIHAALELARRELKSRSETPNLDAQVLLSEVVAQSKTWILTHPEYVLNSTQVEQFLGHLSRYRMGEPLPYVLGWWEFYGRRFRITPEVLIPRPETEFMIEVACNFLSKHPQRRLAVDVGTGSGCVGATLCAEIEDLYVVATDLSWESLRVASLNASDHEVLQRIALVQSDLLSCIVGNFDLVCANLPYISTEELSTLKVTAWEPRTALDGGRDGIELIRRLLSALPRLVKEGGVALFEIGADQADLVLKAANAACPQSSIKILQDHAGYDRLMVLTF